LKLLLDNNVPVYLLDVLGRQDSSTAFREGWHQLANGKLLTAAQAGGFQLLVTLDGGFEHQQNMDGRVISVAVLRPSDQSKAAMVEVAERLVSRLPDFPQGTVVVVGKDP